MTFEMNRDWVSSFKMSAPEYAAELVKNVESAMTDQVLDPVDAHACALAAALASGNGGLAFEISMDKVLFGSDIREAVAKAVILETMNSNYGAYVTATEELNFPHDINGFFMEEYDLHKDTIPEKFALFCLVAAIVYRSEGSIGYNLRKLHLHSVPQQMIQSATRIASVIPAIGKCLL